MLSYVGITFSRTVVGAVWGYANANATVLAVAISVIAVLGVSYVTLRWTTGFDRFRFLRSPRLSNKHRRLSKMKKA